MNDLKTNKVAFITGASGGIGNAVAKHFISKQYFVHGIDISEKSSNFSDKDYQHHKINITDFKVLSEYFDKECFSLSDNVLVNCAGIREICSIADLSLSQWETIFAVNVTATFVASKSFCQKLKENNLRGSVVNIASVSGLLGEPDRTAYVSSKHAVIGLTKQLSIEYGKSGIRVNAIAPGVIRTQLTEQYYQDEEQMKKIDSGQFIKHRGMPSDVAQAAYFLSSDQANFMTGSTLVIDGGWTAGKNL
jgi:NAD(P)-dependent dehydrogenase (short-subunit alcohol dehydrogenase family)